MQTTDYTYTEGPIKAAQVTIPGPLLFIYSPQFIRVGVTEKTGATEGLPVSFRITNEPYGTGRSYTEVRNFHNDVVELDAARILQLLSEDVEAFFDRPDADQATSKILRYSLEVAYRDADGSERTLATYSGLLGTLEGAYGALDQGETYGGDIHRRLWVNFPQTFYARKSGGSIRYLSPSLVPDVPSHFTGAECQYLDVVISRMTSDDIADAAPFVNISRLLTTWDAALHDGGVTKKAARTIMVKPDFSKPGDGVYLRWIDRHGEAMSWLFCRSKQSVKTVLRENFTTHYSGDPLSPGRYGRLRNPMKAEYSEARELTMGCGDLSAEEFDAVCSLATSPVVEMLVSGSPAPADVDPLFKDRLFPPYVWQRVNIAPGTFARGNQRTTPNTYSIEFIVELPERHTPRL